MEPRHREILGGVFCSVLENFAFLFVEPCAGPDDAHPMADYLLTSMSFSGPFGGRLAVAFPVSLCDEIAANVLGLDSEEDEEAQEKSTDAFKEVLNITCGHLLSELAGEQPVFDLSTPSIRPLTQAELAALHSHPETLALKVDDRPVYLQFVMEPGPS